MTPYVDCFVKHSDGAYRTSFVEGMYGSCCYEADEAARHLGVKLFGMGFERAELLPALKDDQANGVHSRWRLYIKEA